MVCYGCFAFFLLLGGLLVTLVGYYPLDMDHSELTAELGASSRPSSGHTGAASSRQSSGDTGAASRTRVVAVSRSGET
jgi:hypothetical protein